MKRWLQFHEAAVAIHRQNQNVSKDAFSEELAKMFGLQESRSVCHAQDFAVRFCYSNDAGFSNCVISLATLKKYDDRPFLVCLLKPSGVDTFLANSTLVKKVSHSSQKLTVTCIRGTILGHDIARELDGIPNTPSRFEALYEMHAAFSWEDNLDRIVAATTAISPTGKRFDPTSEQVEALLKAPRKSLEAERSGQLQEIEGRLERLLSERVDKILQAAETDNVKLRGDAIEQLMKGDVSFHGLEDMVFEVRGQIRVLVDLKTKVLDLSSSPKLYNIDKALRELSDGRSVLCMFFIGIDRPGKRVFGRLVDILDRQLIKLTRTQFHWAGRNSRGVTQLAGDSGRFFAAEFTREIDEKVAGEFLKGFLNAS